MCARVGRQGTHYVDAFTVLLQMQHVVLHLLNCLLLLLAQSYLMKKS